MVLDFAVPHPIIIVEPFRSFLPNPIILSTIYLQSMPPKNQKSTLPPTAAGATATAAAHSHHHRRAGAAAVHHVSHNQEDFVAYNLNIDVDDEPYPMDYEIEDLDEFADALERLEDEDESPHVVPMETTESPSVSSSAGHSVDWAEQDSVGTESSFERYTVLLEPFDIVCSTGYYQRNVHQPGGNVRMQQIVQSHIHSYGKATKDAQRSAILANILTDIYNTTPCPRFLFPGPHENADILCRKATDLEIQNEIENEIRLFFNLRPAPADVIFGRGQPVRDHPGNQRIRMFIEPKRNEYSQGTNAQKQGLVRLARECVGGAGGRFLLPFDKSSPDAGCILADEDSIKSKIGHLFRHQARNEQGSATVSSNVPLVHAHLAANEIHPNQQQQQGPMVHVLSAVLAPMETASMSSSSSSDSKDELQKQQQSAWQTPPLVVSIDGGGQSTVTSTLDDHGATGTAQTTTTRAPATDAKNKFFSRPVAIAGVVALAIIVVIIIVALALGNNDRDTTPSTTVDDADESSPTLSNILKRGYLVCGVHQQEGYATFNAGKWQGFEVDLCRAVAAGIFGKMAFDTDNEPVEFVDLEANERFIALNNHEIDLLLAITTHNMERNVYEPSTQMGYTFSIPYLVNGLIFAGLPEYMACVEKDPSNNSTETEAWCEDASVCVLEGTTHKDIVLGLLADFPGSIITPDTLDTFYDNFIGGKVCNILAGEQFDLSKEVLRRKKYSGAYQVGTQVHSKELIAMVTRDGDSKFSDFVNWITQALLSAEEIKLARPSLEVVPEDLQTTLVFGERYQKMFQAALAVAGGDYGFLYSKHLENLVPRSIANQINLGDTPGMYATEFGKVETDQPPRFIKSPKVEEIHSRGSVNCGVTSTPIFAELSIDNNEWTGLDVDFCKALSAVLFDGKIQVQYKVLSPNERFTRLQQGDVDVLARTTTLTMERDVLEPTTGVGFSFSYPNFRDRIRFAGIPRFRECAENRDWSSSGCSGLRICVTEGTTQFEVLSRIFTDASLLYLSNSTSETVESFGKGKCNVLAGGSVDVSKANIEKWYDGSYDIGNQSFSRESLALVTTEEDPVWSKLVHWTVVSTLWAEEQGITQATFQNMPRVDLFRPLLGDEIFRNAIRAVGSYAEIWERNAAPRQLERDGRNLLNTYPLSSPFLITDQTWYLGDIQTDGLQ